MPKQSRGLPRELTRLRTIVTTGLAATASYGPGPFHCYEMASLPRTNNAQEQYFGPARYHQRRASGRIPRMKTAVRTTQSL